MRPRPSRPDAPPPMAGASNDLPYLALSGAEAKQYWVWLRSGTLCREFQLRKGVAADDRDRLEWASDACEELAIAFARSFVDQSLTTYGTRDDLLTRLDRGLDPTGVVVFLRYLSHMRAWLRDMDEAERDVSLEVIASARALLSKLLGVDDETCLRWARMNWVLPKGDTRLITWGAANESVFPDDGVLAHPASSPSELTWQAELSNWRQRSGGLLLPPQLPVVEQRTANRPSRWQFAFVAYFDALHFRSQRKFGVVRSAARDDHSAKLNWLILDQFLSAFPMTVWESDHWIYDQLGQDPDRKLLRSFVSWLIKASKRPGKPGSLAWCAARAWDELNRVSGGAFRKPSSGKEPWRQRNLF